MMTYVMIGYDMIMMSWVDFRPMPDIEDGSLEPEKGR